MEAKAKQKYISLSTSMKFLVVADPVENGQPIIAGLKKLGFNKFFSTDKPIKAIDSILKEKIEFVFCQYNLDHMDALELMEEIFNDPKFPRIPFVIYSKEVDEADIALMREREADSFLPIPFSQKAIADNVKTLFSKYNNKKNYEYLVEQARLAVLNDQLPTARKIYQALTEHSSRIVQGRAFLGLGRIGLIQNSVDEAINNFSEALTRMLFKVHPNQELGKIFLSLGFTEQALIHFKAAIDLSPKNPYRYRVLAEIYNEHEKYSRTLELIEQAISLELPVDEMKMARADALFHSEKPSEALALYTQILQETGNFDISLLNKIAICFKKQGQFDQAIAFYETTMQKVKKSAELRLNIALTYHQLKKAEDAVKYMKEAVKLNPKYYKAQKLLAMMEKNHEVVKAINSKLNRSSFILSLCFLKVLPYIRETMAYMLETVTYISEVLMEALPFLMDLPKNVKWDTNDMDQANISKMIKGKEKKEEQIVEAFFKEGYHLDFITQLINAFTASMDAFEKLHNGKKYNPELLLDLAWKLRKLQPMPYLQKIHEKTLGELSPKTNLLVFSVKVYFYFRQSINYLFSEVIHSSQKMAICIEELVAYKTLSSKQLVDQIKKSEQEKGGAHNQFGLSSRSGNMLEALSKQNDEDIEHLKSICQTLEFQRKLRFKLEPLLNIFTHMCEHFNRLETMDFIDAEKEFGGVQKFWQPFNSTMRVEAEKQRFGKLFEKSEAKQ